MAESRELLVLTCHCGQRMKVPAEAMGKTCRCVRCGKTVQVDQQNAGPLETTQAPASTEPDPERIGGMLVEAGLVTVEQLEEALLRQQQQGGKTFEILISLGHLDAEALHLFLSRQPGIATIDLGRVSIDRDLLKLIPKELALQHLVLPVDQLGKLLTVAMACPLDTATIAEIQLRTGLKVKAMLCRLDAIHAAVRKYFPEAEADSNDRLSALAGIKPITREDIGERIAAIMLLPVSIDFLDRVEDVLADDGANLRDLAAVCGGDPAFAAVLLQAANSPVYGIPGRVESIDLATLLVGREGVAAVAASCRENAPAAPPSPYAGRARRCAAAAAAVARETGKGDVAVAETAGLVAELGRAVIATVAPVRYAEVDPALAGAPLVEAERARFSHSHADAGPALGTYWRFPQSIVRAMQNYLDPAKANEHAELAGIVGLAAIAAARGEDLAPEDLAPLKETLEQFAISAGDAARLMREATIAA